MYIVIICFMYKTYIIENIFLVSKFGMKTKYFPFPITGTGKLRSLVGSTQKSNFNDSFLLGVYRNPKRLRTAALDLQNSHLLDLRASCQALIFFASTANVCFLAFTQTN